jgi:Putative Ig domain
MRTHVRIGFAAIAVSAVLAALGGCNDDNSGGLLIGSSASSSSAAAGSAPVISGAPPDAVVAGMRYEFRPTVTAADGAALQFDISNQPAWARFDPATGQLSGTPNARDVRMYANISIKVNSGSAAATLTPFTIRVLAPFPDGLAISGTPSNSISAGAHYSFQPNVAPAGGTALTFAIFNPPSWAKFDPATGALTGTPSATDAGVNAHIVITVSDGNSSASLAPFSIAVSSGSSAVATVTWTLPAGSAPSDLAGYRVYYGTSLAGMTRVVNVKDPTSTSYVIDNLSAGTWYFAVASYDTGDLQSSLSPTVSVSL